MCMCIVYMIPVPGFLSPLSTGLDIGISINIGHHRTPPHSRKC